MTNRQAHSIARDSLLIATVVGIPAGVLADSVSQALNAKKADWLYVVAVTLAILVLVLLRLLIAMYRAGGFGAGANIRIEKMAPVDRTSLADVLLDAREEVVFYGISAKRSVTEDSFRRSLERLEYRNLRIRFLLLDPSCSAFVERARDEGESADAWRADMQTTISRLSAHKASSNLDIRLRMSSRYPVWRAIIVDREQVYVSTFLPGKRGTEAHQYALKRSEEEVAHGIIKSYRLSWKESREVEL
ncbi:hypothetical protein ACIPRD_19900 [Streptomyces sp. NPDC090108]|uniref:hypothetical protein n=1 Tax=Streptomyces sp. NPDC090108 TaxID=3365947 RepID=UPI0037F1601F